MFSVGVDSLFIVAPISCVVMCLVLVLVLVRFSFVLIFMRERELVALL